LVIGCWWVVGGLLVGCWLVVVVGVCWLIVAWRCVCGLLFVGWFGCGRWRFAGVVLTGLWFVFCVWPVHCWLWVGWWCVGGWFVVGLWCAGWLIVGCWLLVVCCWMVDALWLMCCLLVVGVSVGGVAWFGQVAMSVLHSWCVSLMCNLPEPRHATN
jgi:hypothetical protein